jgi:TP901 family phage tail tape measure protein
LSDRTIRVRLQAEINSYLAGIKQASTATKDFGRDLSGFGNTAKSDLSEIGNAGLVMGGAIAAAFGAAVVSTLNFDKQISELGAVSGATAEEMDQLRQAALDAGQATAFSASEAALAQTELAKAGVATADILSGGLTGALNLAAAGGIELGDAATYAANAMTTFGLSGGDVGHIADVLAAGANKSAADVTDLGTALQQSGLVADQFGLDLDDSVGVLSAFAQAGLRGSDAGTSFKTMLQRLVPQSQEAAEKMEELGIDMFDAAGNFVGIEQAAQELQDGLSGLTEEQRNSALATIFGSDAVRAATILYQEGADGVSEWISQVDDAGFASQVAADRMDNLSGDLETLRGAIETALIEGGSKATDAMRTLTQGVTDIVSGFSELPDAAQIAVLGLGGLTGAAGLTLGVVAKLGPHIKAVHDSLMGMGSVGQLVAQNMGKMAVGLGVATVAVSAISLVLGQQASRQAEAQRVVEAYTDAIRDQNGELEENVDRVTATELA